MAFKWIRNLTVPKKSNYALSSLEHEEASWAISSDTCEYHAEVGHMAILQLGDAAEQDPEWNITRNKDLILMEPALLERHEIHRIREAQKPKDDFWVVDQQYFVLPFLTFLPFAERLPALDFWSQDDECLFEFPYLGLLSHTQAQMECVAHCSGSRPRKFIDLYRC